MNAELEQLLSQQVKKIIATQAIQPLQKLLQQVANNIEVQPIELAAALVFLDASAIHACRKVLDTQTAQGAMDKQAFKPIVTQAPPSEETLKKQLVEQLATALQIPEIQPERNRLVRYRIEVGQNHQVSSEDIKNILISESGVDRSQIGCLEIRNTYSLIDLPSGMPPDIFQLLQTVEIKQQMLKIKRVNTVRKRTWQRRKSATQDRAERRDSNKGSG